MKNKISKRSYADEGGATIVEYIPIITVFLLVAVPSVERLGVNASTHFCELSNPHLAHMDRPCSLSVTMTMGGNPKFHSTLF
jgi:hypothetical protein